MKNLDEKEELEPFIREILYDPNETPHGPTEIADILTTHVHVRGDKRFAAFVLKGKSFSQVSSQKVAHQFVKLRQIPKLGLMVFGAVGNIQDDAQRDFMQTAFDAQCDFLIIDAQDLARLFIAYEKICPKDGTPYDETGVCKNGHTLDEGLPLEMEVREKGRYRIKRLEDVSVLRAKRYKAFIVLDRHYSKDVIRELIQKATEELKHRTYYRSEKIRQWWGKTPAHVVWLYVACDEEDIQHINWLCRTCWIDPSLPEDRRPLSLNGNEKLGDIDIAWNDDYKSYKEIFENFTGTKEDVLEATQSNLNQMLELANQAITDFEAYQNGSISEKQFISNMQKRKLEVTDLFLQAGDIATPPLDCEDYCDACLALFSTIHDIFLFCSDDRTTENRNWLVKDTIRRFHEDWETVKFEERKIH
jgi:hypothetical protein